MDPKGSIDPRLRTPTIDLSLSLKSNNNRKTYFERNGLGLEEVKRKQDDEEELEIFTEQNR